MADDAGAAEILALQQATLEALLGGAPLPGGENVRLPDADYVRQGPEILVVGTEPSGPMELELDGLPVHAVSQDDLEERRRGSPELAYVRFRPPSVEGAHLRITVEVVVERAGSSVALGGVVVTYARRGSTWEVVDQPVVFAT